MPYSDEYEQFRASQSGLSGADVVGNVAGGAASGVATGSAFGPAGMIVGGVAGALLGGGQAGVQQKAAYEEWQRQQALDADLKKAAASSEAFLAQSALVNSVQGQAAQQQVAQQAAARGLSPEAALGFSQQAAQQNNLNALVARPADFVAAQQATLAGRQQVLQEYAQAQALANQRADQGAANLAALAQTGAALGTVQTGGTAGAQGQGDALAGLPTEGKAPASALKVEAPATLNRPPEYGHTQNMRRQAEAAQVAPRMQALDSSGLSVPGDTVPTYTVGADGVIQVEGVEPLDLEGLDLAVLDAARKDVKVSAETDSGVAMADGSDPFEGMDFAALTPVDKAKLNAMGVSPELQQAAEAIFRYAPGTPEYERAINLMMSE